MFLAILHIIRATSFGTKLSFSNTMLHHLFSQQTLLLALHTLARTFNYVSVPLGYDLPASPHKVLSRLLKLTNFHGNKVHLQWDHIASFHSVMVPTQIPAWDCCYSNPDKLAGTQFVFNTNIEAHKKNICLYTYTYNASFFSKPHRRIKFKIILFTETLGKIIISNKTKTFVTNTAMSGADFFENSFSVDLTSSTSLSLQEARLLTKW